MTEVDSTSPVPWQLCRWRTGRTFGSMYLCESSDNAFNGKSEAVGESMARDTYLISLIIIFEPFITFIAERVGSLFVLWIDRYGLGLVLEINRRLVTCSNACPFLNFLPLVHTSHSYWECPLALQWHSMACIVSKDLLQSTHSCDMAVPCASKPVDRML